MGYIAKKYDPRYWACTWNKKGHKHRPLVSNYPVFDIQKLIKESLKNLPSSCEITREGKRFLKMDISKEKVMVYPEGDYKPYTLAIKTIRCGLGGERYNIECFCGQKYRYLYIANSFLACRKCLNLVYPRQLQTPDTQCIFMENKIKKELSKKGEWDGYTRPFYMHEKTYNRLRDRYYKYEERHIRYLGKVFGQNSPFCV